MTEFRTVIKPIQNKNSIDYNSNVLLFGSCFTEHISGKLNYFKFKQVTNPFGILFNSSAIKTAVEHCVNNTVYTENDLKYHNELWFSLNHHTCFSSPNCATTLKAINTKITEAHASLKEATHIIITLGTAWVYTHKETEIIVGNCHKLPQNKFNKSLQSIEAITNDLSTIKTAIRSINPKCTILYTVSPIRHLRDGVTENSLSKAHLLSAIQAHIKITSNTFYIPAYEIMIDDLRDYRFYTDDMLHPNSTAINYIWNYFKESWILEKVFPLMKEIENLQKTLNHRPFNTDTEAFKSFKETLNKKIADFSKRNPNISF